MPSPSTRPTSRSRISSAAKIARVWSVATRFPLETRPDPMDGLARFVLTCTTARRLAGMQPMDKEFMRGAGAPGRPRQGAGGVSRRCRGGRRPGGERRWRRSRRRPIRAPNRGRRCARETGYERRHRGRHGHLHCMTVTDAAHAIAAKELSPVELMQALLDAHREARSRRSTPSSGSTAKRRSPRRRSPRAEIDGRPSARAAARRAGRHQGHHRRRGPADHLPFEDPRRQHGDRRRGLRRRSCARAGAIVLGKLSTHEFAIGGPSFDLPWPPARNPWNPDHHPGGSSSGSGSGVAAGLFPMALGTDTGGSVRNPASCCGIVGLKPTYGLVSRRGVFPLSFTLDHIGPMTRTVADNALMLEAIAGHDPLDPGSAAVPAGHYRAALDRGAQGPAHRLRAPLPRDRHAGRAGSDGGARARHARAADAGRRRARHHAADAGRVRRGQPRDPAERGLGDPRRSGCASGRATTASWRAAA